MLQIDNRTDAGLLLLLGIKRRKGAEPFANVPQEVIPLTGHRSL